MSKKPVPDLIDLVAGRAYTIDGVTDVTASLAQQVTLTAPGLCSVVVPPVEVFKPI